MPYPSEIELREMDQQLERISGAWRTVRAKYECSGIEPRLSPDAWAELGTASPSMDSPDGITPSLVEAWRTVVLEARAVFLDELVPWATRVVSSFSVDRFPTDAPEPPHVERQTGYYELGESVRLLTGTSDTREAGLRLILWAAAQRDPHLCRRSEEYPTLIWIWISNLVEFSGGICRPVREVMNWVRCGFEHLACNHPSDKSETASSQTPDLTPEGNNEPKQSRFRLERLPEKRMALKIYFDGEEGVVRGIKAARLSLLIRQQRVHRSELAGDLALANDHSVVSASKVEPPSDGKHFQVAGLDVLDRDELQSAHTRLKQLLAEIEEAQSENKRQQLEDERQKLLNGVRRLMQTGSSEAKRAKDRVRKDRERLLNSLLASMPGFFHHLEQAIQFDLVSDMYIYTPGDDINWEIRGF